MSIETWTVDQLRRATLRMRWSTNGVTALVSPVIDVDGSELNFAEYKAALVSALVKEANA